MKSRIAIAIVFSACLFCRADWRLGFDEEFAQLFGTAETPIPAVAWYKLDGNALDSSGNGYHGTVVNAVYTNSAYYFDGSGDYITMGSAEIVPSGSSVLSFGARFRYDGLGAGADKRGFIVESAFYKLSMYVNLQGKLTVIVGTTASGANNYVTDFIPSIGIPYIVYVVYDGSSLSVFVDGVFYSSIAWSGSVLAINSLRIGTYRDNNDRWWKGNISDVRVFNRVLTPANIQRIMQGQDSQPIEELQ